MRRVLLAALATGGVACGSLLAIGDEPAGTGPDARPDGSAVTTGDGSADGAATPPDGGAAPRKCEPTASFAAPVVVPWMRASMDSLHGSPTGRMYFTAAGTLAAGDLSGGALLPKDDFALLSGNANEAVTVTKDELTVFWQRRNGVNTADALFVATRASRNATFAGEAQAALSGIGGLETAHLGDPYVAGPRIYFTITPAGAAKQLYVGTVSGRAIMDVKLLGGISQSGAEHPVLSADEREIFFTADGSMWHATRATPSASFDAAVALPFSDYSDERATWLSEDGCDLYAFATDAADDETKLLLLQRPP
jgi:hypothetical protein